MYFSNGTSNVKGVLIIITENLEFEESNCISDEEGRYLLLSCKIQGETFLIGNIYAPNEKIEHHRFMQKIKEEIRKCNPENHNYVMMIGDWNFTEETIDRSGGNPLAWNDSISIMSELKEKLDMVDIWRTRNPETRRYTWRRRKPTIIQSRIDRIYLSDTLQYNIAETDINPGLKSDHSCITVSIKPTGMIAHKGNSFWKFNNSLLKNEDFTTALKMYMKKEIKKDCAQIESNQLQWEYTKFKIKTWSMKKAKEIARKKRE